MSMRTGINRIALSFGRIRISALLKSNSNKVAKVQAGDFFRGILLKNDPPMEFYSRISIPIYIHSPSPSIVGEQWKYQRKSIKEILANVRKLAGTRSVGLTGKEISFFKSTLLPLLPESFCRNLAALPGRERGRDEYQFFSDFK